MRVPAVPLECPLSAPRRPRVSCPRVGIARRRRRRRSSAGCPPRCAVAGVCLLVCSFVCSEPSFVVVPCAAAGPAPVRRQLARKAHRGYSGYSHTGLVGPVPAGYGRTRTHSRHAQYTRAHPRVPMHTSRTHLACRCARTLTQHMLADARTWHRRPRTHRKTHTHARTHARTHTRSQTHAHAHYARARARMHTCTRTRAYRHTQRV
jgi:hypothetical protein